VVFLGKREKGRGRDGRVEGPDGVEHGKRAGMGGR